MNSVSHIEIRRATIADAQGVWTVATDRSRDTMLAGGATQQDLGRDGFLLYPLQATSSHEPNYRQRIEFSNHFWVACESERIVGFCMAYSFNEMKHFIKSQNDEDILQYFTNGKNPWAQSEQAVYLSQWSTLRSYKNRGIMSSVVKKLLKNVGDGHSPYIVCEIAQSPLKNEASMALAEKMGLTMVTTRTKTDPATQAERTTGIFMRAF